MELTQVIVVQDYSGVSTSYRHPPAAKRGQRLINYIHVHLISCTMFIEDTGISLCIGVVISKEAKEQDGIEIEIKP
ncbi:hypothetical protein COLO4_34206 [Corchorus olitorius]|uniref:Uncharacterized protein n=1 Tax=Corchorus olitorius TaxID=93759 RepID=A0A1R3GN29_9ROSI|nr:hypothetical protein COLO4_34206 [Corchorus olitorius]